MLISTTQRGVIAPHLVKSDIQYLNNRYLSSATAL